MSTTYRVLSDQLYRSVALVTTSNVVTEAYDTDAYGNTLCYSGPGTDGQWFTDDDVQTNNPINTTIFTGRQYDPESQIYYYRARYYSSQIGRFISRDAIKKPRLRRVTNLYRYTGNNPVNRMDPLGTTPIVYPGGEGGPSQEECWFGCDNYDADGNYIPLQDEPTYGPDPNAPPPKLTSPCSPDCCSKSDCEDCCDAGETILDGACDLIDESAAEGDVAAPLAVEICKQAALILTTACKKLCDDCPNP